MRLKVAIIIILFFVFQGAISQAEDFLQLPGVIHVHSTFSSGKYSLKKLVSLARKKGLEVLIVTDNDLVVMEYGIPLFRNIIKKKEERKSVLQLGPQKYLTEITRQNTQQKDVILIPGVQSSPFYYWTGSLFEGNLSAHDYRKRLLLIGMQRPEDYTGLPILHNGFSKRYISVLLPRSILFLISFVLGLYLFYQKKLLRLGGVIISFFSILLLINHHPFQSSRFDPYHGDQGIAPYQEVIDYVRQRNGLTFWTHPQSNYSAAGIQLGTMKLNTKHPADDLITAKHYTGFSAVHGDPITAADPSKQWDRILNEYCSGLRDSPAWCIAGADFYKEKRGMDLDTFQTIFLVKRKTVDEVLQALSNGRTYAVQRSKEPRLVLEHFQIKDLTTGQKAVMGEGLNVIKFPVLQGRVSAVGNRRMTVHVYLIREGKIWQSFGGLTPLEFHFADQDYWGGKTFYRVEIRDSTHGKLLSNPIFVTKN